jgi:hypothetical protein
MEKGDSHTENDIRGASPPSNVVRLPRDWLGPQEEPARVGSDAGADSTGGSDDASPGPAARNEDALGRGPASDWLGPDADLVPFGTRPAADPELDTRPALPSADDFWGEHSASVQDAVQVPVAKSKARHKARPRERMVGGLVAVEHRFAQRLMVGLRRGHGLVGPWRGHRLVSPWLSRRRWSRTLTAVVIAAAVAVTVMLTQGTAPRIGTASSGASAARHIATHGVVLAAGVLSVASAFTPPPVNGPRAGRAHPRPNRATVVRNLRRAGRLGAHPADAAPTAVSYKTRTSASPPSAAPAYTAPASAEPSAVSATSIAGTGSSGAAASSSSQSGGSAHNGPSGSAPFGPGAPG